MKRLILVILLSLWFSGCATEKKFIQIRKSFVGEHISKAQHSFGYNFSVKQLDDDKKAYTWVAQEIRGNLISTASGSMGSFGRFYCEFSFVTTRYDIIESFRHHGNRCRAK